MVVDDGRITQNYAQKQAACPVGESIMNRLRFLHIPKTAGSTFSSILSQEYAQTENFVFSGLADLDRAKFMSLTRSEREKIGLFTGHAPITTGIPEADEAIIITFLRDPISRVKSYCQYVSEGKVPNLRSEFFLESFPLERFLGSENGELSNLQTKMLINHKWNVSSEQIDKMSPAAARDKALENLFGKVSQFGIQEYFNASLLIFKTLLNWLVPSYTSLNQSDPSRLIDFKQPHLDHIAELNSIDIEVYEAANKRLLETLETRNITDRAIREFQGTLQTASSTSDEESPRKA